MSEVEAYLKAREESMANVAAQLRDLVMRRMLMESCLTLLRKEYDRTVGPGDRRRIKVPSQDLVDAGQWLSNYVGQIENAERQLLASDFVKS